MAEPPVNETAESGQDPCICPIVWNRLLTMKACPVHGTGEQVAPGSR